MLVHHLKPQARFELDLKGFQQLFKAGEVLGSPVSGPSRSFRIRPTPLFSASSRARPAFACAVCRRRIYHWLWQPVE